MFPLADNLPRKRYPIVNRWLIWITAAVFLFEVGVGERVDLVVWYFGLVPWRCLQGEPLVALTLVTSLFLHGGWAHLIGNMWFLHIFGEAVEDRLGRRAYLSFYLSCGVLAGVFHVLTHAQSEVPTLGASGAIAGVLAAYLRLFPNARVATLFVFIFFLRILQVPAFLLIGAWFFEQMLAGLASLPHAGDEAIGIAYWAHVGGFVMGFLIVPLFLRPPSDPHHRARSESELP